MLVKEVAKSRFFKDASWTLVAQGGRLVLQGLYFIIVARTLGARGLGAFAGILAFISILSPFCGCGSGNLILKYGSLEPDRIQELFGSAIILLLLTGSVLAAVALGLSPVVLGRLTDWPVVVLLLAAELFVYRFADLAGQTLQATERLDLTAWINLVAGGSRLLAAIVYMTCFRASGLSGFSICYAVGGLVCSLVSIGLASAYAGTPRFSFDVQQLFARSKEGFAYSLGVSAKSIYGDIDKTMLARMDSAAVNGIYTAAYRVITLAFTPVQSVVLSSNTRMFRSGGKGMGEVLRFANRLLPFLAAYAAIVGLATYVAAPLLHYALGEQFRGASPVLRGLAVLPLIQAVHYLYGDVLMGAGHQGLRSACQIFIAVANVLLNLWIIPRLSWRGAVISTLVCEGALALLTLLLALYYRSLRSTQPLPLSTEHGCPAAPVAA